MNNIKCLWSFPIPNPNLNPNPREYWDQNILKWESSRYRGTVILKPFSWSVARRLDIVALTLKKRAGSTSLSVLDLGCGSGVLAEKLSGLKQISYYGCDFSKVAIHAAQSKLGNRFQFQEVDVAAMEKMPDADITVMLGLTDWISPLEISRLFQTIKSPELIFSYTSNTSNLKSQIYSLYRWIKDSKGISASCYDQKMIEDLYLQANWKFKQDLTERSTLPGNILWLKKDTLIS